MKIAFINVMDSYSGGEIVLQRLIRGLDKSKFQILVYTKDTKFVSTLNCDEVQIVTFDTQYQMRLQRGLKALLKAFNLFLTSGKMVYDMKKKEIDIIHSNSLTSSIYFAFWAKIFDIKFIAHNHLIRYGMVYKILYRYIAFCSDKIIVVSDAVKRNWQYFGVSDKKLITVYNGLDNDFF